MPSVLSEFRLTAEWTSAIATFLAVLVALWVAGADARRRAKTNKRHQAELISGWMEDLPSEETVIDGVMYIKLIMQNSSNQLVYNLIARVVSAQSGEHVGTNLDYRNYLGRLPPGRTEYTIKHQGHGMHKRFSVELAFEDSGGTTWVRKGKGGLEQVRHDPLTFYGISPPVSWLMP
jgi:hypothetical protein